MTIWIIADDFTGANDSIVPFAVAGARAVTIAQPPEQKEAFPAYQAVAVNTNSRGRPREEAYQLAQQAGKDLPLQAGDLVYKKIDSALRGNIGAEIDGLLAGLGEETIVLVAPAFPANGRITAGGYQLLNGIPVHETEMARDPVTPVRQSHLPTLLAATSGYPVGHLSLGVVCNGWQKAWLEVDKLRAKGCRLVVADATTNEHLKNLADLCLHAPVKILPCGTAGLAGALAEKLFWPLPVKKPVAGLAEGGVVAIIGSRSPMAGRQIQRALTKLPWLAQVVAERTALASIKEQDQETKKVAQKVAQALAGRKEGVVVCLDDNPAVKGETLAATELAAGLGKIARLVVAATGVKKLFLSGGDIAAAAIGALGGWGLEIAAELEAGVCLGRLQGGSFTGMTIVTKAGSFGNEETLARTLEVMRKEESGE